MKNLLLETTLKFKRQQGGLRGNYSTDTWSIVDSDLIGDRLVTRSKSPKTHWSRNPHFRAIALDCKSPAFSLSYTHTHTDTVGWWNMQGLHLEPDHPCKNACTRDMLSEHLQPLASFFFLTPQRIFI